MKNKNELVIKSNALLQQPLYKTTLELKIFSKIVLALRAEPNEDIFTFEVKKILDEFGCNEEDYKRIKTIAKNMSGKTVDLNKESKYQCDIVTIFRRITIDNRGLIIFKIEEDIKPYILNLKSNFTRYYFDNIARLNSSYSIRIYEFLKQHQRLGNIIINIIEFRAFLNIPENKFKLYGDFKRKAILHAQEELKEKTDIEFEFEEIKQGNKVIGINFIIHKNKKIVEQLTAIELMATQDSVISTEQNQPPINEQVEHLVAMGVTRSIAEEIAAQFPEERIAKAIAYTLDKQQEGGVKNSAAFVVTAIKKDFNDVKAEDRRKKAEILRLKKEQDGLKKQWQAIKKQYSDWKTGAVEDILANMTAQELDDYQHQFRQTGIYELMRPNFRKNPEAEQRYFKLHIRDQLPMDTLEQWAQKNTVDLSVFSDEIRRD